MAGCTAEDLDRSVWTGAQENESRTPTISAEEAFIAEETISYCFDPEMRGRIRPGSRRNAGLSAKTLPAEAIKGERGDQWVTTDSFQRSIGGF